VAVGKDGPATPGPEGGSRVEDGDAPEGYENLTRIDQGGFAVVYRARDTCFDRTVALKILRSDSLGERQLRRFRAECLAIGRVSSHPNIVTVYDAGTTGGHRPWLAMEYCSGGSLAHRLARVGPLPVAEVVSIGARLCGALSAAHEAGILHRDVKPRNVLLTSYGEPALADFGIASVVVEDDSMTETAAYTVLHAAPEILEGQAGTAAADIYSLGSTLYTLLAGQAPFAREASTGLAPLVTRILRGDLPVIARHGVPPELEKLLRSSMSARPQDRPTSAELGASLTGLGQRLTATEAVLTSTLESPVPVAPPISARRRLVLLGGTVAVMAVLAAVVMAFMAWGPGSHGGEPRQIPPNASAATAGAGQAAARYAPTGLAVTRGRSGGELMVSWNMPIRPDVVATVIYQGPGTTMARAIFNYGTSPTTAPQVTMRGLPAGRTVCLSAAHVVSIDNKVTNAVSRPVCAVPR
jgi:tRNA A-37 threonylcarbamoyl transferase component Bud32